MTNQVMTVADAILIEMQSIVRRAGEPWAPGDSVKAAIGRAARRLGLTHRRARTFWYAHRSAVLAVEADRLRAADLRLLAERHRSLTHELNIIKARLNARGSGHGETDRAGVGPCGIVGGKRLAVSREVAGTVRVTR